MKSILSYISTMSLPDDPSIKILKVLGRGYVGTVYLTEINHIQYVTKIQRFDGDTTLKGQYARLLQFDKDIASKHPADFMTIHSSKIIYNSKHIQETSSTLSSTKYAQSLTKHPPHAFIINYNLMLDNTYTHIKTILTPSQELDLLKQIDYLISILSAAGYRHRDISGDNIMYKATPNGYKWHLIDYASVWHNSFIHNAFDVPYDSRSQSDRISLVLAVMSNTISIKHKLPSFTTIYNKIRDTTLYKKIYCYLPERKSKIATVILVELLFNAEYFKICTGGQPTDVDIVSHTNLEYLLTLIRKG